MQTATETLQTTETALLKAINQRLDGDANGIDVQALAQAVLLLRQAGSIR